MIGINIDNVQFEVWGDKTLWSPPSAAGEFVPAPDVYATMARALVCCDYDDRDDHTYVGESLVLTPVAGNGVHFPLRAGMPPIRATKVVSGVFEGQKVISILEWDDPLDAVITTREAEALFSLKENSANKAVQRGFPARKSGKVWLLRRTDARQEWG